MKFAINFMVFFVFSYAIPISPVILGTMWMRARHPGWRHTWGAILCGLSMSAAAFMFISQYAEMRAGTFDWTIAAPFCMAYVAYVVTCVLLIRYVVNSHRAASNESKRTQP